MNEILEKEMKITITITIIYDMTTTFFLSKLYPSLALSLGKKDQINWAEVQPPIPLDNAHSKTFFYGHLPLEPEVRPGPAISPGNHPSQRGKC